MFLLSSGSCCRQLLLPSHVHSFSESRTKGMGARSQGGLATRQKATHSAAAGATSRELTVDNSLLLLPLTTSPWLHLAV